MLRLNARGYVIKPSEVKQSAKGTHYVKFALDTHPTGSNKYPKRLHLIAFGALANKSQALTLGTEVEVVCEPSAKAYTNKKGEPAAFLEAILSEFKVLTPVAHPTIEDDDIPF